MALTRPMLKGMGLTEEQVQAIIDAHTESTDALKKQRDEYKDAADQLKAVQKELEGYKNGEDWQAKYKAKDKELADYKADIARKEALNAKKAALGKLAKDADLSEAGVEKALKYTDYSTFELDADGNIKEAKALMDAIKSEWAGYIKTAETRGAQVETPPAVGNAKVSKADIYKRDEHGRYVMSTAERQKALAENPELMK